MDTKTRAEKIVEWINVGVCRHQPATPRCSECMTQGITSQLDEVVREAVDKEKIHWIKAVSNQIPKSYADGFAAAREKAAGIAKNHPDCTDRGCFDGKLCGRSIASNIRAMEVDKG